MYSISTRTTHNGVGRFFSPPIEVLHGGRVGMLNRPRRIQQAIAVSLLQLHVVRNKLRRVVVAAFGNAMTNLADFFNDWVNRNRFHKFLPRVPGVSQDPARKGRGWRSRDGYGRTYSRSPSADSSTSQGNRIYDTMPKPNVARPLPDLPASVCSGCMPRQFLRSPVRLAIVADFARVPREPLQSPEVPRRSRPEPLR